MSHRPSATGGSPPATAAAPGRTKIFVNVGKKDRAGPKDLVGALIREVGLEKTALGKIEVREAFSVVRSEEHTSELQSRGHLVCRLLLEKNKQDFDTRD